MTSPHTASDLARAGAEVTERTQAHKGALQLADGALTTYASATLSFALLLERKFEASQSYSVNLMHWCYLFMG